MGRLCILFFCAGHCCLAQNMWVIHHLGVLASGTLFLATQMSMLLGRPFTENYAREHVPKELWNSSSFIRSCIVTTSAWSSVFLANTMVNVVRLNYPNVSEWPFRTSEYLIVAMGIIFTSIYSQHVRRKRVEESTTMDDRQITDNSTTATINLSPTNEKGYHHETSFDRWRHVGGSLHLF